MPQFLLGLDFSLLFLQKVKRKEAFIFKIKPIKTDGGKTGMVTVVLCIVYFLVCGVNKVISKEPELLKRHCKFS